MTDHTANPHIAVLGGGAWGTALACVAAKAGGQDNPVTLWAREDSVVDSINTQHVNTPFLPGIPLPAHIVATTDIQQAATADIILAVIPTQHMRASLAPLTATLKTGTPIVLCSKGIEKGTGKLLSDVINEVLPQAEPAILSGPSFAKDVAIGLPTAVTLAARTETLAAYLTNAIGLPTFRPYFSDDLIGAQMGGAIKNVLAIACGIVEGKNLGESARAALTTRGFAEMVRFGEAMGAKAQTIGGLSGLGDLVLTCSSPTSRNMSLGLELGQGKTLDDIMTTRTSVSEGVHTAPILVELAKQKGVDMPIAQAVSDIVTGAQDIDTAITNLLARPFTAEHETLSL